MDHGGSALKEWGGARVADRNKGWRIRRGLCLPEAMRRGSNVSCCKGAQGDNWEAAGDPGQSSSVSVWARPDCRGEE